MSSTNNISAVEAQEVAAKAARTRKILAWTGVGVIVIVAAVLIYVFGVRNPGIAKGNDAIGQVDILAYNGTLSDSIITEQYKNVADNYGYDAANRAKFETASGYFRQGNYEEALKYIEEYDPDDAVIGSLALALKGDCLVNLDRLDDALKAFNEAIDEADENPELIPYYLTKKAVILSAQGNHSAAVDVYKNIERNYPDAYNEILRSRCLQAEGLAAAN